MKTSWLKVNNRKNSKCDTAKLVDLDFAAWELLWPGSIKVQEKKTSKFHIVYLRHPRQLVRLGVAGDLYWIVDLPEIMTKSQREIEAEKEKAT